MESTTTTHTVTNRAGAVVGWVHEAGCENVQCRECIEDGDAFHAIPRFGTLERKHYPTRNAAEFAVLWTTRATYSAGDQVVISDGMSTWDPAVVLSGPHQPLTTEHAMWLVRVEDEYGTAEYLVHAEDMRAEVTL